MKISVLFAFVSLIANDAENVPWNQNREGDAKSEKSQD